jgi:hypothetical protein
MLWRRLFSEEAPRRGQTPLQDFLGGEQGLLGDGEGLVGWRTPILRLSLCTVEAASVQLRAKSVPMS